MMHYCVLKALHAHLGAADYAFDCADSAYSG